ncbi:steroid 17-alpha-hydroxylase/17,20 lyase-like [Ruditapes philippinarum]|uniref:steroid 17-alpha-hydroxylase/17,20 lyase-like n=1 Tax=Ruditapes philippinarum TaxID=129788 RepID=UPI00295A5D41|nr:steroid 17-alpha-hydroxylase/17,20 lyase-like [Ruditapes philippinarum]XP_060567338.1 steroid 17-alpha-hydroxylase/17,20 lyase-like [Ruditapes philippinarum]XP_060567339.1 steroid 17-alpha-hydroxylase/17,20 lyase-like [Ruditapes philippinarum]
MVSVVVDDGSLAVTDSTMLTLTLALSLVLLLLTYLYKSVIKHAVKYSDIPAVNNRWPFIGNLFDMSRTHIVLTEWAKEYGPVFRFNLFGEEIVVLNDYDTIYEALVTRGSDFAGRPHMSRTDYQDRNKNSIVWQTYTPKLQFLRKQIHSSLRMYGGGLNRLQDRCGTEITELISRIDAYKGQAFDPWSLLYCSACNIMLDLAIGIRFPYNGKDLTRLKEINGLFNHSFGPGSSRILDHLPMFNIFQDEYRALKQAVGLRNQFWLDHNCSKTESRQESVISDLQKLQGDTRYKEYDVSESTLKETFTNLILAGTDTTTTALTCFLLVLLYRPEIQKRLHTEIDHVIGSSREPSLSDRPSMPYMEACLYETLRYISHVPLAVPHATTCDTSVGGKRIPKNTTVYINLWALHHDENFWSDPWKFDPHRFLDSEGHLVPTHHENRRRFMVFGAGRRVCLGEALAKNRLFLFTVSLLQKFRFENTAKVNDEQEIDPREFSLGIVLHPRNFTIKAIKRTEVFDVSLST